MYRQTSAGCPQGTSPSICNAGTVALCNLLLVPLGVPLSAPRGRSSHRTVELPCQAQKNIKGSDEHLVIKLPIKTEPGQQPRNNENKPGKTTKIAVLNWFQRVIPPQILTWPT
jgi:hypothetical protein